MTKLTQRQLKILEFIQRQGSAGNQEIQNYLKDVSRITVVRELNALLQKKIIIKKGKGRNIYYQEKIQNKAEQYVDLENYFQKGPDQRELISDGFNFDIFTNLRQIFNKEELGELKQVNKKYQKAVERLNQTALKKEFERLTIELSWKSSQIEGNTYSLIDTEILIKEREEAEGHKKEEAIMILNHKKALDYIMDKKSDFKNLNLLKIRNIHNLIIEDLSIEKGLRKWPVGIIGTRYKPLDNEHQIQEAMEKTIKSINEFKDPFSKTILAILMLSYIQPFTDGNKRTARLLGNAILLAHYVCPLSYRSVNEADYKKAMILFYEQNNIRAFKDLFVEQLKFAIENYFN